MDANMGTTLLEDPGSDPSRRSAKTMLVDSAAGKTRLATTDEATPSIVGSGATGTVPSLTAEDPVVGWLVIISGPGKGNGVPLGRGMNSIGRGEGNRVVIAFGDMQITSEDHFRIAYDPESREFHLVPAKGTNLLYLANKAVLSPMPLEAMADIRVGATTLRFVPFCGTAWDWADV